MSNLKALRGVGEALIKKLNQLKIFCIEDLLFHLPRSYQDRTRAIPISELSPYQFLGREVFIEGEILNAQVTLGRRRSLVCYVGDPNKPGRALVLRFFYFNASQQKQFISGKRIRAYGEFRLGKNHGEMIHPEYKIYEADALPPIDPLLTPMYSLTEGLTQNRLRGWIRQAFEWIHAKPECLPELFPAGFFNPFSLMDALQFVHFPPKGVNVSALLDGRHEAQQRLILEELLAHRLGMEKIRTLKESLPAIPLMRRGTLEKELIRGLPFSLTKAQQRVLLEIAKDLEKNTAMHRLLQGDVGSGKTLVALIAALQAVENSVQVAVMAPTEILAEQHYMNFQKFLGNMKLRLSFLTGSLTPKRKEDVQQKAALGEINILVGTQALFQEGVNFKKLGLAIIDEQHRFGVEQRQALLDKSLQGAHQLIMTATPIPRTLAMTSYADLDISVIDELPMGRKPITTLLVNQERRLEVMEKIRHKVASGRQVYWVCTLIEESEHLDSQAAEDIFLQLQSHFVSFRVGLVHGRMKPAEKQHTMQAFKEGQLSVLVATTVIEVGVDVPNATVMVIENPERLGLAQLHQLRGRVGRGSEESFCILLYQSPLSKIAQARLTCLKEVSSGFEIAEKDLELRGAGEVLGTRQTGDVAFKIADLIRDRDLLDRVKQLSEKLSKMYEKNQEGKDFLTNHLVDRWFENLAFKAQKPSI